MDIKPKKCKGTGQAHGYGCSTPTLYRTYGLCNAKCYPEWLYTSDAGKAKMKKALNKVQKPRKDLEKAKEETKNRKGLSSLLNDVKKICHEYIRLRDKGKNCISCQNPYTSTHQAGHFYKAELFSTIRFNELNINGQCEQCNLRKEGNESEYRVNLPNRIGIDNFNKLNDLAAIEKKTSFKWDKEELKKIRTYYRNKIKQYMRDG